MNIIKKIILISSFALSATVFAHSDGHGKITADKVLEVAQTSAKMLSFKDHGMSVGKIDKSWADVTKEQFSIVEEGDSNYIVKAMNSKTNETFYFNISKKGEIKEVKNTLAAKSGHGHSH
ncbi:DUF6488 family protein [Colwellia psychrerythraea]|uniref:PepSY domain-containing protein n=1 Tax=Colwellia psychrerythraea TaxID=28229 RepID=A0A099KJI9_COLPS|nr:DUF6488 family protein [Colwellia psychrerythraea]KGJ90994.1 hypothetical protein GAB14E_0658 [Colwellia psychrerythraea]